MKAEEIRTQFPALDRSVYGKPLIYLDNAATAQRLRSVGECWMDLSYGKNANIHRAVHRTAIEATEAFESARDAVRDFLHAGQREEIIFTSGATAAVNLVAFSFGEAFVHEGDEIIVSEAEHHSNLVPWQLMAQRKGAVVRRLPVDDDGLLRLDILEEMMTDKTRLVAVCQVSNVLGLANPLDEVVKICRPRGVKTLVDGAQGIVHQGINLQEILCDFYVFSGHKMYAAPGTGVLFGRKELLDRMPPYMGGGEMIETVRFDGTTFAPLPAKFEAGTQNLAGVPTLVPAVRFLQAVQSDPEIQAEQKALEERVSGFLLHHPRIHLAGVPRGTISKTPIFSFWVEGVHHEDLALILDKMGIALRSGQMCAEPLMDRFGVTGMLRASFAPYNTMAEAETFLSSLEKAINMLS